MKFNSKNHYNSLIPTLIKGVGSEIFDIFADEVNLYRGNYINNTELGIAFRFLFQKKIS